jgi:hypothetical protein
VYKRIEAIILRGEKSHRTLTIRDRCVEYLEFTAIAYSVSIQKGHRVGIGLDYNMQLRVNQPAISNASYYADTTA